MAWWRTLRSKLLTPALVRLDEMEKELSRRTDELETGIRNAKGEIADISGRLAAFQSETSPALHTLLECTQSAQPQPEPVVCLSNQAVDVSVVSTCRRPFFWVTAPDSDDPISAYAKRGIPIVEPMLARLMENRTGTFLDIGANIGAVSLTLAADGWRGYAFEASSKNASLLEKSICLNDFDIEIVNEAVYDKTGRIFFVSDGPWGFVRNAVLPDEQYEEIRCVSVDDWDAGLTSPPKCIDFIKIDIEGSEVAALHGMRRTVERYNHPPIFIEMNAYALCWQDQTQLSLLETLSELGYTPYEFLDGKLSRYPLRQFPDRFCRDFILFHGEPEGFPVEVSGHSEIGEEEMIQSVLERLRDYEVWDRLARYGREKSADEYGAYICYALKDYPQYHNLPEVASLLREISGRENNAFVKKAISWFRELGR